MCGTLSWVCGNFGLRCDAGRLGNPPEGFGDYNFARRCDPGTIERLLDSVVCW